MVAVSSLEQKYADITDAEVRSIKEAYAEAEAQMTLELFEKTAEPYTPTEYSVEKDIFIEPEDEEKAEEESPAEEPIRHFERSKPSLEEAIRKYQPHAPAPEEKEEEPPAEEPKVQNLFEQQEVIKSERTSPYLITPDEFHAAEKNYEQQSLVYYVGGDDEETLADDREMQVEDIEQVVGSDNLEHFGEDPKSRDTIYVRNEWLGVDFEISRDRRSYVEAVLGIPDELMSKDDNRPKKRSRNDRDD